MNILIDDERNLHEVKHMLPHLGLDIEFDAVFRTYHSAVENLSSIGENDTVFLDHDLGTDEDGINGHGVIKKFSEHHILPKMVIIVSANPIGLKNIVDVLVHDMRYKKIADRVYSRD